MGVVNGKEEVSSRNIGLLTLKVERKDIQGQQLWNKKVQHWIEHLSGGTEKEELPRDRNDPKEYVGLEEERTHRGKKGG